MKRHPDNKHFLDFQTSLSQQALCRPLRTDVKGQALEDKVATGRGIKVTAIREEKLFSIGCYALNAHTIKTYFSFSE